MLLRFDRGNSCSCRCMQYSIDGAYSGYRASFELSNHTTDDPISSLVRSVGVHKHTKYSGTITDKECSEGYKRLENSWPSNSGNKLKWRNKSYDEKKINKRRKYRNERKWREETARLNKNENGQRKQKNSIQYVTDVQRPALPEGTEGDRSSP